MKLRFKRLAQNMGLVLITVVGTFFLVDTAVFYLMPGGVRRLRTDEIVEPRFVDQRDFFGDPRDFRLNAEMPWATQVVYNKSIWDGYEGKKIDSSGKAFERLLFFEGGMSNIRLYPDIRKKRSVLKVGDETIYDVAYSTDGFGRRSDPDSVDRAPGSPQNLALAFLGCSFTFGEGLNYPDTLPRLVENQLRGVRSYNYGVPGGSPATMLMRLQTSDLREEIPEGKTLAVYSFLEFHIQRLRYTIHSTQDWRRTSPYIGTWGGEPVLSGRSLQDQWPFLTFIFRHLYQSAIFQHWAIDIPWTYGHSDFVKTAQIFEKIRFELKRQKNESDLVIFIYPDMNPNARNLMLELEKRKIHYVDFSSVYLNQIIQQPFFAADGHPTERTNRILAPFVAKALQNHPLLSENRLAKAH